MDIRGGEAEGVISLEGSVWAGIFSLCTSSLRENRGGEAEERRVCFEGLKAGGKRRLADRQTSEAM